MNELVSIIILNYNRNNDNSITIECLKSLENQIYSNFEIILVDNGSDHKYYLELKKDITQFEKSLSIHLIRIERNLFFVSANNKAIKKANGEIICLLNNDTEVMPDFLEKMLYFLKNHPEAGLICPKIKVYKNKEYLWYAGADLNLKERKLIHIRGQWELDPQNIKYNEVRKTDFAAGTAVVLKKEIINKIGLMDEIFLFYNEDPDWNIRAQKLGYVSYYVPSTIVYHKVTKRMDKKRVLLNNYFYTRNSQILVWKHAKPTELLIFYRKFILENIKEILTYIFLGIMPVRISRYWAVSFISNKKNKELYRYLTFLRFNSIIRGLIIGIKRKLNISCKKNLVKDYRFSKFHEKKIQTLNLNDFHFFQSF